MSETDRGGETARTVTKAEIEEIMADEGYSADQRKAWIKSALTNASKAWRQDPTEDAKEVVDDLEKRLNVLDDE